MWPLEDAGWTVPDFSVMLVAVNLRPQQIQRTDLLSQCLIRRYQPSDVRPTPHSKMSSASKKKTRQYSEECLKFGFVSAVQDEWIPFCILCQQFLSNESMKRGHLEAHSKAKHSAHINTDLNYFETLKENSVKRTTIKSLFTAHTSTNNRVLEASYQISLFIAKTGKNHTHYRRKFNKTVNIRAFLKTVLEKDDKDVKAMPLSKNTVSRKIDEMGEDIEKQLVENKKILSANG
ncbi:uncharacterized protein TNCV_2369111 [Trichonephila clavipes]|nr:uncharacterized protein TNCV_2369111 [Trichonephila clavipes]